MGNSGLFYTLIVNPGQGFGRIIEQRPWILMVFIFILARLSATVGRLLLFPAYPARVGVEFFLITDLLLWFFLWVLGVGMMHLFAELWGNQGRAINLFLVWGFVFLPLIFISPIVIVIRAVQSVGMWGWVLLFLLSLGWLIGMGISALKNVYSCSGKGAFLILISPILFIGVLFIFASIIYGVVIFFRVVKFFQ